MAGYSLLFLTMPVGTLEQITETRMFGMKDLTGGVMAVFNALLVMRGLK